MDSIKEAFPVLLALAVFGGCLSAASPYAEKRLYFLQQLKEVFDAEEIEVIKWYRRYLKNLIITQISGGATFAAVILLFADVISSSLNAPGNVLFRLLGFVIAAISFIIWLFRRSSQQTIEDSIQVDSRPPVLFLRSFEQDDEAPLTILDAVSPNSKKLFSYEDLAIGHASMVGPVVAIASPFRNEKEVLGAAKSYVDDWQKTIQNYMKGASLIIMRPYNTKGVLWEFDQLVKLNCLHKTILYVQMGGKENASKEHLFNTNKNAYDWFRQNVFGSHQIDLGNFNPKAPMTFFDIENAAFETNDYFDIPAFRKVFHCQYMQGKNLSPTPRNAHSANALRRSATPEANETPPEK